MVPVEASLKATVSGATPPVGLALKATTGGSVVVAMVVLTSFEKSLSFPEVSKAVTAKK